MRIEAGYLSRQAAEWFGDAPALTFAGETRSFRAVNEGACRLGSGLLAAGLERGDRVAVLAYNRPELVETWLGLEKHNLVRAVLHSHIDAEAHAWSIDHIDARAVLFDSRLADMIDPSRHPGVRAFVAIGPDAPAWAVPYDQVLAAGSPEEPFVDVDEDAPCFLQLTSGTTGNPKPWIKTYRSWHAVVDHNLHHLDTFGPGTPPVQADDVNLHFHPLQWATGFQTLYPYLLRGGRTVLLDDERFDPDVLLDTIAADGVTGTFMPGPLLTPVLDAVAARGRYEHQLRRMVIFFGTPDLLRRTSELLGPIWAHGFGSSEQGAVTTRLLPSDLDGHPERIESVGRSGSPFFDVAIFDPLSGRRLGPSEIGEIAVRSAMSLGGYWGLEEATREASFGDDWFRPRDVGFLDADGYLYYADRAGDEIRLGDTVVYPHYVEAEIMRHEAVALCGVVGLDEAVVAAVLLKDAGSGTERLEVELRERCAAGGQREPDRVVFVAELPTVLGGAKVQRRQLREQLLTAI
ncbi:MAG TPA: class I adenylate-forming enzyme family protein [Solirubrobacter sp.]|nr:class I adenylate-forming enzyme family protein [Solirubrobacter sp.]